MDTTVGADGRQELSRDPYPVYRRLRDFAGPFAARTLRLLLGLHAARDEDLEFASQRQREDPDRFDLRPHRRRSLPGLGLPRPGAARHRVVTRPLGARHVPSILAAFDLGSWGRLSSGPVASGRLGSIWRLDTERGSWALKQVGDIPDAELAALLEGAAFQEAALADGVPTAAPRRTRAGELIADCGGVRVRVHGWVDLHDPDTSLDPVAVGRLVAALHRVDFTGAIGLDPWYTEPVRTARWADLVRALRARHAAFADALDALRPELVALEAYLGGPPRDLRTCHRDLWADNVRRARDGGLCVFDFDNAGLADPSQELALILSHDRRRTGRQRRLGPRVRRPAADPSRDRGAPGRMTGGRSIPRSPCGPRPARGRLDGRSRRRIGSPAGSP